MKRSALSRASTLGLLAAGALSVSPALASSHREAPLITEDPAVDCTDVYSFVPADAPDTVTVVANYYPLNEPSGGPNYYLFSDNALYEIHIDNDGDGVEDITYQWQFTTTTKNDMTFLYNTGPITAGTNDYTNLNVVQRYTLRRIDGDRRTGTVTVLVQDALVAPNNVGPKSIANYSALEALAIHALPGGGQVFAGPRDDPFFIHLGRAFDLLNVDPLINPMTGAAGGALAQCNALMGGDLLAGFNCLSLVIQLPKAALTSTGTQITDANDPAAIVGIWSTSSRRQVRLLRTRPQPTQGRTNVTGGAWVQTSRLGMPLVNELVIPRRDKDVFNNSEPMDDAQFLTYVQQPELAGILNALFGITVPATPRTDLVDVFLLGVTGLNRKGAAAEYQRLNTAIAPDAAVGMGDRLAVLAGQVSGFPNGRRLEDDVVDIALRVVAGQLVFGAFDPMNNPTGTFELGDTICENDRPFSTSFPYLAQPHDGVSRQHENE